MYVQVCRERFHTKQWHLNFSPPMAKLKSNYLFVGDFVLFKHICLGQTTGKIERFFAKVNCINWLFVLSYKEFLVNRRTKKVCLQV